MSEPALTKNLKGAYGTLYYVKDMQQSIAWYKNLGLTPAMESSEWTEFSIQGHSLCLHLADDKAPKNASGFLIIRVNNIHDVMADLAKRNVTITEPIQEVSPDSNAYCANICDLDGNNISFYEGP